LRLQLQGPAIEQYFKELAADIRQQLMSGSPRFAEFDTYPADAQMGILALAWAVGAGGILASYNEFRTACFRRHWQTAANQSGWASATAGRRSQVRQMFMNADAVETQVNQDRSNHIPPTLDMTRVYFPQRVVTFAQATPVRAGTRPVGH
jgi:hypothetical protein